MQYLAGADQNAAISGGTIRITLRRPPEGGFYGSVTANGRLVDRSCGFGNEGVGGMFNYRIRISVSYDNLYIGASKMEENAETMADRTGFTEFYKLNLQNQKDSISATA